MYLSKKKAGSKFFDTTLERLKKCEVLFVMELLWENS